MFHTHFAELAIELSGASTEELQASSKSGGWRKALLDDGKIPADSWTDFSSALTHLMAFFLRLCPPIGSEYRRALVAQSILDRKSAVW